MGEVVIDEFFDVGPRQLSDEVARLNVEQCNNHQYGIEHADAAEIAEWPEMSYPFLFGGIIDVYGLGYQFYAIPHRAGQNLQLKLIFSAEVVVLLQFGDWVKAKTTLCIGKIHSRFYLEPEVGKFVGKTVFS